MSHYLALLNHPRQLAAEPSVVEELGAMVVDSMKPRLLEVMPEVSAAFVSSAIPQVQLRLTELQPQLDALAIQSAQAVLNDQQIRETVKLAVAESTAETKREFKSGLLKLGAGILLGVLAIEIIEPNLPGRK